LIFAVLYLQRQCHPYSVSINWTVFYINNNNNNNNNSYPPSHRALLSFGQYQFILLGIRGISSSSSWCIDSCGPLRRLSTVSTFLRTLPHLSPAGWGSLADLLYACPPGTPRRSLPVRTRAMTSLCCDDLFQWHMALNNLPRVVTWL